MINQWKLLNRIAGQYNSPALLKSSIFPPLPDQRERFSSLIDLSVFSLILEEYALASDFGHASNFDLAVQLLSAGQLVEALERFDEALAREPESAKAWLGRGVVMALLEKENDALESFEKALAIDPHNAEAWYNLANALVKMGRFEEALQGYNRAVEMNPYDWRVLANKGNTLCLLSRQNEAVECYNQAIAQNPSDLRLWVKGSALLELGKPEEAIASLCQATRLDSGIFEGWYNLGLALMQVNRCEEAIRCFDRAIEMECWGRENADL